MENEVTEQLHLPSNAKSSFQDFAYWLKTVRHVSQIVSNQEVVNLLVNHCSEPYTQVRVVEKGIVDWTIIPLLRYIKDKRCPKLGAQCLAALSTNKYTHKKILEFAGTIKFTCELILNLEETTILTYALEALSKLAAGTECPEDKKKYTDKFINIAEFSVINLLDNAAQEYQSYILSLVATLVSENSSCHVQMREIIMRDACVEPILRSLCSTQINVIHNALLCIQHLLREPKYHQKLLELNLNGRLIVIHNTCGENSQIMEHLVKILKLLLKSKENYTFFSKTKYVTLLIQLTNVQNQDIVKDATFCLAQLSEHIKTHKKLIELNSEAGALNANLEIIKNCKKIKIIREACRFISNIS